MGRPSHYEDGGLIRAYGFNIARAILAVFAERILLESPSSPPADLICKMLIENRIKKNETKQIVVYDFLLKRVIEKNLLLSVVKILIFVLKLT